VNLCEQATSGPERTTDHAILCDSNSIKAAVQSFVVRIVLADERPVVRCGLRTLLSRTPDLAVIAEAATARDTVRLAVLHRPDVLIVDVELPGFQVDSMIREVRRVTPSTAILVFSAIDADDTVVTAVRAGARGYLLKSSSNESVGNGQCSHRHAVAPVFQDHRQPHLADIQQAPGGGSGQGYRTGPQTCAGARRQIAVSTDQWRPVRPRRLAVFGRRVLHIRVKLSGGGEPGVRGVCRRDSGPMMS